MTDIEVVEISTGNVVDTIKTRYDEDDPMFDRVMAGLLINMGDEYFARPAGE